MRASPVIPAIVAAATLALVHGCTLPLTGASSRGDGGAAATSASSAGGASTGASISSSGTAPPECVSDGDCAAVGPCRTVACSAGVCVQADAPDQMKIPDDEDNCKATVCVKGEPTTATDLLDFKPSSDPCVVFGCDDAGPTMGPAANGTDCGTGQHCLGGVCHQCAADGDCAPDPDNDPCTTAFCDGGGNCAQKNNNDPCTNGGAGFCVAGSCCSTSSFCLVALACCAVDEHCTFLGCKPNQ